MNKTQLVKYKKERFFDKICRNLKNIFSKDTNIKKEVVKSELNTEQTRKEEFFEIYNKVKKNEINIENLDNEILEKILKMMLEEININSNKINEKISSYKINLDNLRIYNKEIESVMKNKK